MQSKLSTEILDSSNQIVAEETIQLLKSLQILKI